MKQLLLINPDVSYADQIRAYRQEFLTAGSSMDGTGSLRSMEDPQQWLQQVKDLSCKETVPENWVQSTQFLCVRRADNAIVGMIQVRHYFNDFLEAYGGHIGYSVRPSERRKGYASRMLHDLLPYCKQIGLQKVLITCEKDNEGSRRTILKNGGVYESTVFEPDEKVNLQRYWIHL